MKKILLVVAALMAGFAMNAQTLLSEGFEGGSIPAGWTQFNDENTAYYTNWTTQPWITLDGFGNPGYGAASCSWFSNSGFTAADRWLITPAVTIPADMTNAVFMVDAFSYYPNYPESFEIRVCTGTPSSRDSFETTPVLTVDAVPGDYTTYTASLAAYAGQTVYLAVRHTSYDMVVLGIDNIFVGVLPENEIALTSLSMPNYNLQNNNFEVTGTVKNKGSQTITSFELAYTVNGGTPVTQTITCNIPSMGLYDFTASTPVATADLGTYTINVTVSNPNQVADETADNSMSQQVVVFVPQRNVVLENFTTAQCGNCPSAHQRMHNALENLGESVTWICHHAGYYTDGMTTADDETLCWFYNSSVNGGTYAPAAMLDRTYFDFCDSQSPVFFPGNTVGDMISAALAVESNATIEISNFNFDPQTRDLTCTVSGTVSGLDNPTLSVYLIQDSIIANQSGGSSNYQHNGVYRLPLLGDVWGKAIANGSFSEQVSYRLPTIVKTLSLMGRCRVVAFVGNRDAQVQVNNEIANSTWTPDFFVPKAEHTSGINDAAQINLAVYPNPATNYVVISAAEEIQNVTILNLLGQQVYSSNTNDSEIVVSTENFATGMYIATVKTATGISTQRFTVAR